MSKGLGSTFSITQQICQCFGKQIHYGNCFVSILAQLLHSLMQYLLLYYYMDSITHVSVLHTINYTGQAPRDSKSSLLSAPTCWWYLLLREINCDLWVIPGETHGIFPISHKDLCRRKHHCIQLYQSQASTVTLPIQLQANTPMVHRQDPISIPAAIMATSYEFSELQLSPHSVCTALEGHSSLGREELLLIAQGLAGVVQKNQEVGHDYQKQLEVLHQQGEDLAKHEVHMACLEVTYQHWKADTDRRDAAWEREA